MDRTQIAFTIFFNSLDNIRPIFVQHHLLACEANAICNEI